MRPSRFGSVAPDNLVTGQIRFFVRVPLDWRVVRKARRKRNVFWSRRSRSQNGERGCVNTRDIRDVVKVVELWQVSVLNSVFHSHVLMLMLVILVRLSEAHGGVTPLEKRLMIPAASVAIAAIDHPNCYRWHVTRRRLFNKARQLTRL